MSVGKIGRNSGAKAGRGQNQKVYRATGASATCCCSPCINCGVTPDTIDISFANYVLDTTCCVTSPLFANQNAKTINWTAGPFTLIRGPDRGFPALTCEWEETFNTSAGYPIAETRGGGCVGSVTQETNRLRLQVNKGASTLVLRILGINSTTGVQCDFGAGPGISGIGTDCETEQIDNATTAICVNGTAPAPIPFIRATGGTITYTPNFAP